MQRRLRSVIAIFALAGSMAPSLVNADVATRGTPVIRRATTIALLDAINAKRIARGRTALREVAGISDIAQSNSEVMAAAGTPSHTPNLPRKLRPWRHTIYGENVAGGGSINAIMSTWMDSDQHRANILKRGFRRCGVGLVEDADGTLWATVIFID